MRRVYISRMRVSRKKRPEKSGQAFGIPAGNLDSNVMLFVSSGNFAAGRCAVEAATGKGLCAATDGLGPPAGFTARINAVINFTTGITYWDGTYSFESLPDR